MSGGSLNGGTWESREVFDGGRVGGDVEWRFSRLADLAEINTSSYKKA